MVRLLVTGATGFIGKRLVRSLLSRGHDVRCLVRRSSRVDSLDPRAELFTGNLLDISSLRKATVDRDVVFHLAGKTISPSKRELVEANGRGTNNVLAACAGQPNPPVCVVVSSLAAAGTSPPGRMQTESDLSMPISNYGFSKRVGEVCAHRWARELPVSVVRPGIVFGPGNVELLPVFRAIYQFRFHAVPTFGRREIAFIHVDDLIDILDRVVYQGARISATCNGNGTSSLGYYFANDDQFLTFAQFGRMIGRAFGVGSPCIFHVPESLLWAIAGFWQLAKRQNSDHFNLDKIREAIAGEWTSSNERAKLDLQYHPTCSLQVRINQTANWYRESGWL